MSVSKQKAPVYAGILMRVSSAGQEDGYSLADQERDCRRHAGEQGYTILGQHVWNDGAQKSYTLNRPGLKAAMEAVRNGEISVLLVGKYDRFSRIQMQQAVAIYQIEHEYGGVVESANAREQFGRDSTGVLLRNVAAYGAERELESIRERTQGGRRSRARDGKIIPGAWPNYGYEWADRNERRGKSRLVIDDEAAAVVQRIYQEILAGKNLYKVARDLTRDHIDNPAEYHMRHGYSRPGKYHGHNAWSRSSVQRILTNSIYKGEYVAYRTLTTAENKFDEATNDTQIYYHLTLRPVDHPDRVVIHDAAPAIVSAEVWEAAQSQLKANKRQARRNQRHEELYLLRGGYAVCGYCGRVMTAISQTVKGKPDARKFNYRCNGVVVIPGMTICDGGYFAIAASVIDSAVWDTITFLFEDPKRIHTLLSYQASHVGQQSDWTVERIRATKGLLERVERQKENAARAVLGAESADTFALWNSKVEELAAQARDLRNELAELDAAHRKQKMAAEHLRSIEQWVTALGSTLQETTYAERRQLLRALDVKVTVYRSDHTPRYVIQFDLSRLRKPLPDLDLPTLTDSDVQWLRSDRPHQQGASKWQRAILALSTPS